MERGAAFFRVKGQGVDDKQQFLAAIAAALNFPDYFGNNWDALEDCLTDMSWHDAAGYVVLLDEMDCFAESRPDEFSIALEILQGVAEYWRSRGKHMAALVQVSRAQEWKLEPMGFDPESS
jgi:RNAse (barnase) inhibitor barstar